MALALRALAVVTAILCVGLAARAPRVAADVVLTPIENGPDRARYAPPSTLVTPTGARRRLAGHRIGDGEDGLVVPSASPDGRFVARRFEHRIVVVPTDGARPRMLAAPGVRAEYFAGRVWWDRAGAQVFTNSVRDLWGDPAVQRCVVATGSCTTTPVGTRELVGPLPAGGAVWTGGSPWQALEITVGDGEELLDATDRWLAVSRADVRRVRRALRRRIATRTVVLGPDGASVRTLWSARRSAAAGIDDVSGAASGPTGTLVGRERVRHRLRTRTRAGRLELRLVERRGPRVLWQVDDAGGRTPIPSRSAEGDRFGASDPVGTPDGWAQAAMARHGTALLGVASADGATRRVLVGGRPVTVRALHDALALPAGDRPDDRVSSTYLGVAAYEASTRSLIVGYGDAADRSVLARVPLDGGVPTLVTRTAGDVVVTVAAY
jgi:hypothetical protein